MFEATRTVKELETVLADPEVEDNWAKEIIKLAVDGANPMLDEGEVRQRLPLPDRVGQQ